MPMPSTRPIRRPPVILATVAIAAAWVAATAMAAIAANRHVHHIDDIHRARDYASMSAALGDGTRGGDRMWITWSVWAWLLLGLAWLALLTWQWLRSRWAGSPVAESLCLLPVVGLIAYPLVYHRLPGRRARRTLIGAWVFAAAVFACQVAVPALSNQPHEVATSSPIIEPADQVNGTFRRAVLADAQQSPVPARGPYGMVSIAALAVLAVLVAWPAPPRGQGGTGAVGSRT
jgi:hypothetical protein